MIYDSLQILEGSKIINTTVESGASFPANPNEGQLFFKTDVSKMYVYNGTSWAEIVKAAESASAVPRIASVAVTNSSYIETNENAVNTAGGFIKITGFGFVAGCTVLVGRLPATSVSRVSAEELRVQVPAQSSGNYPLYVVNPDGGTGIFVTGITYDPIPVWSTAAALGSAYYKNFPISVQLSATENATITYSLRSGSSLPPGLTLSSSGLLSGTVTELVTTTTYSFDIVATDDENQIAFRTFSITISPAVPVDYLIIGGGGGGGTGMGGGGGGGGDVVASSVFQPGTYTIVVGAGGAPGAHSTLTEAADGRRGEDSRINSITAFGGGGGGGGNGRAGPAGTYGGGGGGSAAGRNSTGGGAGAAGTQGGNGANPSGGLNGGAAGGGGAGGNGLTYPPSGGVGIQWLNGQWYGGGGAGVPSGSSSGAGAAGGIGGGGGPAGQGADGFGGGGGGGDTINGATATSAGRGGSGVVIIRYAGTQKPSHINGGSVSVSGGFVYHTFTTSGTFTIS